MNAPDAHSSGFLKDAKVLVVDDDPKILRLMAMVIQTEGATIQTASSGEEALKKISEACYDLLITDVRMQGIDGMELLRIVRKLSPGTETIVITGHGDIPLAVRAMKEGAYDFLTKPFPHVGQIIAAAERALEKNAMRKEIKALRSCVQGVDKFESLVGGSLAMQKVYERIQMVAPTDSTVLIQGETGTGKELVAHAMHSRSKRAAGPFIAVNCGTLTESLLESELFGHVKGAFTGAVSTKIGLFEAATGGTIFLDEIDSTSPHTQVGLLRILQEKQVRPVGSVSMKTVDTRIVVSSQKNLFKLTEEGKFRKDLFYRISAVTIALPPLRERMEDVPILAEHFLKQSCEKASKQQPRLSQKAMETLTTHHWPGNVRELQNVIEHAALFCQKPVIDQSDLHMFISAGGDSPDGQPLKTLDDLECEHILQTLKAASNNKVQAARILGIPRTTLYERMKKHRISTCAMQDNLSAYGEPS